LTDRLGRQCIFATIIRQEQQPEAIPRRVLQGVDPVEFPALPVTNPTRSRIRCSCGFRGREWHGLRGIPRIQVFQGPGLAGRPAWMKAVAAASRQPERVALARIQCLVSGTGTSSAFGIVAVAAAALAGGPAGSAVPLRKPTCRCTR
jgi:hypothetical protein